MLVVDKPRVAFVLFSLTPVLSPGEREDRIQSCEESHDGIRHRKIGEYQDVGCCSLSLRERVRVRGKWQNTIPAFISWPTLMPGT
jgi:hypothetical protein